MYNLCIFQNQWELKSVRNEAYNKCNEELFQSNNRKFNMELNIYGEN